MCVSWKHKIPLPKNNRSFLKLLVNLSLEVNHLFFSPSVEWNAKLNVRVMEPDPNSENIAAISQSSVGSDCKYKPHFVVREYL